MGAWIETMVDVIKAMPHEVAPFMGAWIETVTSSMPKEVKSVAPFMGAWIETQTMVIWYIHNSSSHPSWVRGLKRRRASQEARAAQSHPSWVRGLKRRRSRHNSEISSSHPSWVRGLKQLLKLVLIAWSCRTLHGCVD